nr:MAG TPA: hypothetical protein [Caudoviricetes sp.]
MGKMKIKTNKNDVLKRAKQTSSFRTIGIMFEETEPIYYSGPVLTFVDIGKIMAEYKFRKSRDEIRGVNVRLADFVEKAIYEAADSAADTIRFNKFVLPPQTPTTMSQNSIETSEVFQIIKNTIGGINNGTSTWEYPAQLDGLKIKPTSVHVLAGEVQWDAKVKSSRPLKPIKDPKPNIPADTAKKNPEPPVCETGNINLNRSSYPDKIDHANSALRNRFNDIKLECDRDGCLFQTDDHIWKSLDCRMDRGWIKSIKPEHMVEIMPIIDLLIANNLIIYSSSSELGLWESSYMKLSNPSKCAIFGRDAITVRSVKHYTNVLYVNMDLFKRILGYRYTGVEFSPFIRNMTGIFKVSEFAIYNLKSILGERLYRNHVRLGMYRSVYDHMEILGNIMRSKNLIHQSIDPQDIHAIVEEMSKSNPENGNAVIIHDKNSENSNLLLAVTKVSNKDISTAYPWESYYHDGMDRVIVFDIDQVAVMYKIMSKGIYIPRYDALLEFIKDFKKIVID